MRSIGIVMLMTTAMAVSGCAGSGASAKPSGAERPATPITVALRPDDAWHAGGFQRIKRGMSERLVQRVSGYPARVFLPLRPRAHGVCWIYGSGVKLGIVCFEDHRVRYLAGPGSLSRDLRVLGRELRRT
jgi:hypothetical protein